MKKRKFKFGYIIIGLIVCYTGYIFVSQQIMINRLNDDIQKLTIENKKIEDANSYLQDEIKYAGSDEYVERLARERMGLTKPGETVYKINRTE